MNKTTGFQHTVQQTLTGGWCEVGWAGPGWGGVVWSWVGHGGAG